MTPVERLGLSLLHRLDPERAHHLSLCALRAGFVRRPGPYSTPRLATGLAGLTLPNPVGLAAGFDKNAVALATLTRAGFGFIEVGAATPRAQPGNPRPRLFRLTEDRAVINRFGFNNDGVIAIAARLAEFRNLRADKSSPGHLAVPVGLNLGANKDSPDRAQDFATVLASAGPHLDFATVNVSSPNTERLRDLQGRDALAALLRGVLATRDSLARPVPVFLKIAPDLTHGELSDVAEVALACRIDAIIATNTTLDRTGLRSPHRDETGGLSGRPLFDRATRVLAQLHHLTGGAIPLIGVGGIASAGDAYAKIRAGATAVQLYSALVWGGFGLVDDIARGLDALLARDGFANVAAAIGTDRDRWL